MVKVIWAHVTAIPVNYPDEVELEYRVISPATMQRTGERYKDEIRPWDQCHSGFPLRLEDLRIIEGYLKNGERAYMGLWNTQINPPEEQ